MPKDTTIVLLFNSGKYELDSLSKKQLDYYYDRFIIKDKRYFYTIAISGYADNKGNDSSNYHLSKIRAIETGKYLISLSNDTVIKKIALSDFMTPCGGVKGELEEYKVPIAYRFFGEEELKYKKVDSLNISKERKVLVSFTDNQFACLGVFGVCKLPSGNTNFKRDSTIQVFLDAGYIDQYTIRANEPCKYDSLTNLELKFIDSLPTRESLCERINTSFKTKLKNPEVKVGSLSFSAYMNDSIIIIPVCNTDYNTTPQAKVLISEKIIPCKNFYLYTGMHKPLAYRITDGFIETYLNLNASQKIEVFIQNNSFKNTKLIVRGRLDIEVSTIEPTQKCKIDFDIKDSKGILFFKRSSYSIIKFSKEETILHFINPKTDHLTIINLKDLKFNKRKDAYIVKGKELK